MPKTLLIIMTGESCSGKTTLGKKIGAICLADKNMKNNFEYPANEAAKILKAKDVPFRVIRLSDKGVSSRDVVKYAIDCLVPEEICKTIITKDRAGNFYALLLKGGDKIDFVKVKNALGCKVNIVNFNDVKLAAGTEPGAICPITLDMPIFVDEKVFKLKKINFGSGDHKFGIEVSTSSLAKIFDYQAAEISQ